MTPEQFAYWLQGFAELNQQAPNTEQWQAIRDHLSLVFKKETPETSYHPVMSKPALTPLEDAIRRFNERQDSQLPRATPFAPTVAC
jgi:hypothetical protein